MTAELKWYFLLAYSLTWAFTIPFVIAWHTVLDQTLSPWVLVFLPAPFGPTFAASSSWREETDGPASEPCFASS